MLRQIFRRIRPAQNEPSSNGQEPYQNNTTANTSQKAEFDWQPLDVSKLNITSNRLREIEASLAEKTRAEFAAVTSELNRSQDNANQN